MGTPKLSSAASQGGVGERSTAQPIARWWGGKRGEWGNSQLSAKNFKSRSESNAMRLSSSPISKELGWKQPFDGGKFALILLARGE